MNSTLPWNLHSGMGFRIREEADLKLKGAFGRNYLKTEIKGRQWLKRRGKTGLSPIVPIAAAIAAPIKCNALEDLVVACHQTAPYLRESPR